MPNKSNPEDGGSDCEYRELEEENTQVKKEDYSGFTPKQQTKSYIYALCAGVLYAIGNYIIGSNSGMGFLTLFCFEGGTLIYALIFLTISSINKIYNNEKIWSWEESNFRHPKGGLNKFNISYLLCYASINIATGFVFVYWFQFALYSQLNQGIVSCLFALTSVFSAIISYVAFGERLKKSHMIGIWLMLICVAGLSFGSTAKASNITFEEPNSISPLLYSILAILFAILSALGWSFGGLLVRIMSEGPKQVPGDPVKVKGYNPTDMTITSYFCHNLVYVVGVIVTYQSGAVPFILTDYLQLLLAGIFGAIGVVFMNKALTIGYAGPIFALWNMQVVILAILDVILLAQFPSALDIISAWFGIAASCTIALVN